MVVMVVVEAALKATEAMAVVFLGDGMAADLEDPILEVTAALVAVAMVATLAEIHLMTVPLIDMEKGRRSL